MKANPISIVVAFCAVLLCGSGAAGEPPAGKKHAYRSKPTAPIDVRWIENGADGRVEIEVVAGVDHVGTQLRLVVPGAGAPLGATLPAAAAGEIQTVSWTLDRPLTKSARLSLEVDTGDAVMAKQVQAPRPASKRRGVTAPATNVHDPNLPSAAPVAGAPAHGAEERLVTLPAEVTIRRAED